MSEIPDPLGLGPPVEVVPGTRSKFPPGTRRITSAGYIVAKLEDGRTDAEHRLVMEGILGRPLTKAESARHRNEDKLDNREGNLALYRNGIPVDLDAATRQPRRRASSGPRPDWRAAYEEACESIEIYERKLGRGVT